jgi:ABC-type phosphate/phosphonate transport system substrate-binding protein
MPKEQLPRSIRWPGFIVFILGLILLGQATAQQPKSTSLRIGTSGILTTEKTGKEESALETLRSFIKEETGMDNEILRQKDWRELTQKLVKGELDVGVFQGFEFAWAEEKHPDLKPLALAVNVYTYPVAYVVTSRNNKAQRFADLQGQSLAIPLSGQRYLRLFVERESQVSARKPAESFFSKIITPEQIEDALDDTVDGVVQAMVADRAALEAFRRRKPARFKNLKEVARSPAFPPTLVAYYGKNLDPATLERLRTGLLDANRKEKGETLLTLFKFTGFAAPPNDFDKVLAETRETYPPPPQAKSE